LSADDYARVEAFLGYNYVHFYSQNGVPSFSANGGSGQFTYNFDSLEEIVGGFRLGQLAK
jgi:hypothetical protein